MTISGMPPTMVGERLGKIRRLKGYSQQYMAQRMGISERQYSRYETGEAPLPDEKLTAACEALEVEEQDVRNFDEKMFFHQCTQPQWFGSHNTYNGFGEQEREAWQGRVEHLEEEVAFLRRQLEAALGGGGK